MTYPGNSCVGVNMAENSLLLLVKAEACCLLKTRTIFDVVVDAMVLACCWLFGSKKLCKKQPTTTRKKKRRKKARKISVLLRTVCTCTHSRTSVYLSVCMHKGVNPHTKIEIDFMTVGRVVGATAS